MGFRKAHKAAGIARNVEKDITERMNSAQLMNYKNMYAWGTEGGNHIFDQVAAIALEDGLGHYDQYLLSLVYMHQQSVVDGNHGATNYFARIIREVLPSISNFVSMRVLSEASAIEDTQELEREYKRQELVSHKQEHLARERQKNLVEQENRLKQLRKELHELDKSNASDSIIMFMVVILGVPFSAFLFFQGDVKIGAAVAIFLLITVIFGSVRQLRSDKLRNKLKADLDKLSPRPDQSSWLGSLVVLTAVICTIGYFLI